MKEKTPFEKLVLGSKLTEFKSGSGVIFIEQNPLKVEIIRSALSKFGLSEKIIWDKKYDRPTHYLFSQKKIQKPQIEFRKINPSKYRLRIHGASGDFPVIFSERFNPDWKAYLLPWTSQHLSPLSEKTIELLSNYKVLEGNDKNQANLTELKKFLSQGWITDIKNKISSETTLRSLITDIENTGTTQEFTKIDFISKNFFGSIQNDNLPANKIWESWFPVEIVLKCTESEKKPACMLKSPPFTKIPSKRSPRTLQWPNLLHWEINSFANSWWIKTDFIRSLPETTDIKTGYYQLNTNGTIDFEIVLEFWPQRLFYMGGVFSITLFVLCITALLFRGAFRFFISQSNSPHQNLFKS